MEREGEKQEKREGEREKVKDAIKSHKNCIKMACHNNWEYKNLHMHKTYVRHEIRGGKHKTKRGI